MNSGIIYITGIGGSGKSSVKEELKKRGYEAHDVDEGFANFFNIKTNEKVTALALKIERQSGEVDMSIFLLKSL